MTSMRSIVAGLADYVTVNSIWDFLDALKRVPLSTYLHTYLPTMHTI
jgi:hypothetical protein